MHIIEGLLLLTLFLTCIYTSITDIRHGIIQNKILVFSGSLCGLLNFLYYSFFGREYVVSFAIDFVVLVTLSVIMYAFNLWAAGDSKLLFLIAFAIPARFYNFNAGLAPAIFIIVFTFSISFVYIVGESIVLRVKNHDKIHGPTTTGVLHFLKNYVYISVYIIGINYFISYVFPDFVSQNSSLISIAGLFISIVIYKYPVFFKWPMVLGAAIFGAVLIILYGLRYGFYPPNLKVYIYVAIILFFRSISEKYNYLVIPTDSVAPGMILSAASVIPMRASRAKGLPQSTTEDMRSRLTPEEVDAIRRWKDSKYGHSEISIVRKIPFAIFMTLGVLVFLMLAIPLA